ncbi:hypothetical protein UPYG_G00282800 [Umbra pygmaea]|uniref:Protein turtle homolog A-like n=1 Tax=Umbra pygmaea TaxID=75934 RepID=A0ABD0W423_UMBPY
MGPKRDYFLDVTVVMVLCLLCAVSGQKPEVRAQIGGVVEMDCRLPPPPTGVSAPLHVVEWVRQGLDIPVLIKFGAYAPRVHPQYEGRVSLVRDSVLRVEGLLLEDQGLYECRILLLDKASDETRNGTWTRLSVTAPPVFTKTPPPVVEAVVGNPLSLACVARGNPPPTITWAKDGILIGGENAEVQSGTLSLKAVSMEAKGQYECIAFNTEGNVTHVTKLDIKGPPVIVIPPEDTTLNMTQNALLRCQAVADPPNMTYVWQRQGENVYHIEALKSRVKIMVDGTLLITRIMPDDSGNYTCMPTNGLLTPPTASASLTVRHSAQVLQMPPQTYLPTGLGGLVSCPVRAQPPLLRVDWTKDGQPLDLEMYPGWSMTTEGSVFMATVNDDATGVYTCTPYNSYGTMGQSGPTTVILQDPPSLSESPNKEYRQEVGRTLVIPCQTTGDPTASVTWNKVGPGPRPQYLVAANGSLLLPSLSKVHQGEWMCSVTNRVATVTAGTLISVLGTSPHAANRLSVSPGATQANVSWEPGFDGGYTQKFTVWLKQVALGDSEGKQEWLSLPVPSASGYRLQVTGLIPATEYQFSVLPHNKVGTGPFSEIASIRTLNSLPRRAKLEPPRSLSAYQSSAGIVLQWSRVSQYPPVSGFVLQMRGEQGEWLNLDENIGASRNVTIVSGLRKDSAYTLRLLSRRGELLSEPSPSVNVSTTGMDMYPASARLLDNVPESLLAGVIGGVVILCLVLILVIGSFCVISHRRKQHHRRNKNDLIHPAIYISPPKTSPDSVLKQKLLPPHSHCPGSTLTSSCTASCSSSQSDHSSFGRPSRYQDQRQNLLSCPPHALDPSPHHRHHLPGTFSCHTPPVEFISRGPDGRFMVQPYDQSSHTMRSLRKDFPQSTEIQRSVSLRSEKSVRREPPFVLSVELPPCADPNPNTRVRAMAKHLSLHGHLFLDGERDSCAKPPDESSLYSDCNSDMYPQSSLEEGNPGYRSLKRAVQPETASNLVLQMEHERETGNLSRCLKLAHEREQLERELRKYTLERNAHVDENQEGSGRDEENWRDTEQCDPIWKPKDNASSHIRAQANRGRWEASPLISATNPVPPHSSERTKGHCDSPLTQHAPLSAVTHCPPRTDSVESHFKRRLIHHPLGPPDGNDTVRVNTHRAGIYHEPHMSAELRRDEFESPELNKNNQCPFNGSVSHTSKPGDTVNKVPDSRRTDSTVSRPREEPSENNALNVTGCVEMSVDEPEDEVSVDSPAYPTMPRRHAHHISSESLLAENNHRGHPLDPRARGPRSRSSGNIRPLRKAVSLGGFQKRNDHHYQRSQSLDSKTQSQGNFLTPDAWIHSLSQENCSSPYSFRSDPEPMSRNYANPAPICPTPPPHAPYDVQPHTKSNSHIAKSREPVLERQQQFFPPPPTPVPSGSASRVPNENISIFPDASKWSITYQEALRSVQRTETRTNTSLPRAPEEHPIRADCTGRTTPPSLERGYCWSAPNHTPQPPEEKKDMEVEGEERYGGHEAEMGRYHQGVPDSGGSYSSCASQSSGRGSLEPPNSRLSICLSPTPSSTPGTTEEIQGNTQESQLPDMELLKSRKASVDENYEWDSTDFSIQPGERDLEGRGVFSVGLQKYCPTMNHSRGGLKDAVHLPGHRHLISHYSETEPETVLF